MFFIFFEIIDASERKTKYGELVPERIKSHQSMSSMGESHPVQTLSSQALSTSVPDADHFFFCLESERKKVKRTR